MFAVINRLLGTWKDLIPLSCFAIVLLVIRLMMATNALPEDFLQLEWLSGNFLFLAWNLFLAWVPLMVLSFLNRVPINRWLVWPLVMIWLLFFPNAPYLITDLVHLRPRLGVPLWYDATMLFTFALLGLLIAVQALQGMQIFLRQAYNNKVAGVFIGITVLLSGLGVYLGRVLRWNSWDVFQEPLGPIFDTLALLRFPMNHKYEWLMIATMTGLLASCYWWGRGRTSWGEPLQEKTN